MRTVLNILNFVLGGFATTLAWLLATLVSIVLIFTLPLTRSCWEITNCPCSLTVMKPFTLTNLIRRRKRINEYWRYLADIFWLLFSAGGYA